MNLQHMLYRSGGSALAFVLATTACPALAQVAGSVTVQSEYRLHGNPVSGGKPVAIANFAYDDPSGFYISGTAIDTLRENAPAAVLGVIGNAGYVHRITRSVSLDGGVIRTQYFHDAAITSQKGHYTEAYIGIIAHRISSHLFIAPDYFGSNRWALYGEVEGALEPIWGWSITGHLGAQRHCAPPPTQSPNLQYDWRLGLGRKLGPFGIQASLTGGQPGKNLLGYRYDGTAVIGGVSWTF